MRFIVVHTLGPKLSRDQAQAMQQQTRQDAQVKGYRSFVNLTLGRVFCIYDSPSQESLEDWLRRNSLPFDEIMHVEMEGEGAALTDVPTLTNVRL